MGQADFKVGDRVRIAALGRFREVHEQGLFVGNTGTVVTLFQSGNIGIRTDGPADDGDSLSWGGDGWPFHPGDLELIAGDDSTDAAAAERIGVLAWLDSLYATTADGAVTNRKWPEAQAALAAVAELVEAATEMMRQDAVQRATELTNPFMAGAADKLGNALRKVGAR